MPEFQIIWGPKEEPKENWDVYTTTEYNSITGRYDSVPAKWNNAQDPNSIVRSQNSYLKGYNPDNIAYMLQRLPDPVDFLAREVNRSDYLPFEVQGQDFHCAELKDGAIQYYSTKYAAYDDKRSTMKLGRYLKAYTDMSDNAISDMCALYGVEFGDSAVKWARTREEIAHVYATGPRSCMKSGRNWFTDSDGQGTHPAEAYASPDIAVAYIEREGRVTARAVINMIAKKYITIYGDSVRLKALLRQDGIDNQDGTLEGCRLLKIDVGDGRYACPYLDCGNSVIETGDEDYLLVSADRGAYSSEDGYVTEEACNSRYQTQGQNEEYDDDENCGDPDCEYCY